MIAALTALVLTIPAGLVGPSPLVDLTAGASASVPAVRCDPSAPTSVDALPAPHGSSVSAGGRCLIRFGGTLATAGATS